MPQKIPHHRHRDAQGRWTNYNDDPKNNQPVDNTLYATAADLKVLQDQINNLKPPPVVVPPTPVAPVAAYTVTPTSGKAGDTFQFHDTSTGDVTTRQWDIGAGDFRPTEKDPVIVLPSADLWHVVLTVGNTAGSNTALGTIQVDPATVTPPPVITPPGTKSVTIQPSITKAQLITLIKDLSVGEIVAADGTYNIWSMWLNVDHRANPLIIRPAHPGSVIFDGNGSGDGLLYPGFPTAASSSATGGVYAGVTWQDFILQHYNVSSTGVVTTGWVEDVAFDRFTIRNCVGAHGIGGQLDHAFYCGADGGYGGTTHQAKNIRANNWDVTSAGGLNGLHMYHPAGGLPGGVQAHGWVVRGNGAHWGAIARDGLTGLDMDGWTIDNVVHPIDFQGSVTGIVKNCKATNSGSPIWGSVVNGGGNTLG